MLTLQERSLVKVSDRGKLLEGGVPCGRKPAYVLPSSTNMPAVLGQVENIWMLSLRKFSQFEQGNQGLQLQ